MRREDIEARADRMEDILPDLETMLDEIRDAQTRAFLNSGADDTATREEAHAIVRALEKVRRQARGHVNEWKLVKTKADTR